MSGELDRTDERIGITGKPAGSPDRDAMWEVISASWDDQLAGQRRRRVVRSRLAVAAGIAATLLIGVFAGRWSIQDDAGIAPAPAAALQHSAPLTRRVALEEHLRDSETLLALFLTDLPRDDTLAVHARELAAASRMLLAAGAGSDAELVTLLQDLELLLLQIAQVAGPGDSTDLEITQSGIRDADAIARTRLLRSHDARFDEI